MGIKIVRTVEDPNAGPTRRERALDKLGERETWGSLTGIVGTIAIIASALYLLVTGNPNVSEIPYLAASLSPFIASALAYAGVGAAQKRRVESDHILMSSVPESAGDPEAGQFHQDVRMEE